MFCKTHCSSRIKNIPWQTANGDPTSSMSQSKIPKTVRKQFSDIENLDLSGSLDLRDSRRGSHDSEGSKSSHDTPLSLDSPDCSLFVSKDSAAINQLDQLSEDIILLAQGTYLSMNFIPFQQTSFCNLHIFSASEAPRVKL